MVRRHRSAEEKVFWMKGVLVMLGGRGRSEGMARLLGKVKAAFATTTGAAYPSGIFAL
ncbi:hypothetical protein GCM10025794_35140 [Massilia kyonggiensis]